MYLIAFKGATGIMKSVLIYARKLKKQLTTFHASKTKISLTNIKIRKIIGKGLFGLLRKISFRFFKIAKEISKIYFYQ